MKKGKRFNKYLKLILKVDIHKVEIKTGDLI